MESFTYENSSLNFFLTNFLFSFIFLVRPVAQLSDLNCFDTILGDSQLTNLETGILVDPSFTARLTGTAPTTVLAPIDSAFQALSTILYGRFDLFRSVVKTPVRNRLTRILNYHLIDSTYWEAGFQNGNYNTLLPQRQITMNDDVITDFTGRTSNVIAYDLLPTNGVIHKIDTVLLPEDLPTFATTLNDWDDWQAQKFSTYRTNTQNSGFFDSILNNRTATTYTLIAPLVGASSLQDQRNLLIEGIHFSNGFTNDLVLTSVGGNTLRFNLYESWHVNGRPLITDHIDWVTVNGAMHVYSDITATIPFFTSTVWDKIPDTHPFKASLATLGLQNLLSGNGGFTVLLPNAQQWTNVADKTPDLIRYHVIPQTIFKPHFGIYPTLQGSSIRLNATGFDDVPVSDWSVVSGGCTNGMVVNLNSVLPVPPPIVTTSLVLQTTGSTTEEQVTTGPQVTTALPSATTDASGINNATSLSCSILFSFVVLFYFLF